MECIFFIAFGVLTLELFEKYKNYVILNLASEHIFRMKEKIVFRSFFFAFAFHISKNSAKCCKNACI